MDNLTIITCKINNIYVDTSFTLCLVIFGRIGIIFLYNRINFQINMSFCQLTQHGFIRHMKNNTHKHPEVLQTNKKHMKWTFKNKSEPWIFLWCLRASKFRKVWSQEGHTSLTPKWSLHTCEQMAACEVDGPSLHPSTWHLYTLLMPQLQVKGCHVGGMATSKA